MTTPEARAGHLDGVAGGRGRSTQNTYHLRPEFFTRYPGNNPWGEYAVQVAFDNFCAFECHDGAGVADMRHGKDAVPTDPDFTAVEMGSHLTRPSTGLIMDLDLDVRVAGGKNYAPCVACHDPHGTGIGDTRGGRSWRSNLMLRRFWRSDRGLCVACHT